MAIFKIADTGKNPYRETYIAEKITYILQPQKILSNQWGGYNFLMGSLDEVIEQFYIVRNVYHKTNYIPLRHYILSFDNYWEDEITPFQAKCIAYWICKEFATHQYQVIYAVHEDTYNLHIHILLNTINLVDGKIFNSNRSSFQALLNHVEFVLKLFHLWHGEKSVRLIR